MSIVKHDQRGIPVSMSSNPNNNGSVVHPPSSSDSFLSVSVACFANIFPTLVDPVKDTFLTSGFVVSSSPTSWIFS